MHQTASNQKHAEVPGGAAPGRGHRIAASPLDLSAPLDLPGPPCAPSRFRNAPHHGIALRSGAAAPTRAAIDLPLMIAGGAGEGERSDPDQISRVFSTSQREKCAM